MPDPGKREMTVTLPAGLFPVGGSNVLKLAVVADEKFGGGKRAIQRSYRDANASDAGRIRRIEWGLGGERGGVPVGAIGHSLFSQSGVLGVDFCLTADSIVSFDESIKAISRRSYVGEIVKIATSNGYQLSGTPNHPVLTNHGWVEMGALREGDYVVSRPIGQGEPRCNPDCKHVETTIGELYSLAEGLRSSPREPELGMNLNGDSWEPDVDVISIDSLLWDRVKAAISQPRSKLSLTPTDKLTARLGVGRKLRSGFVGVNHPASSRVQRCDVFFAESGVKVRPVETARCAGSVSRHGSVIFRTGRLSERSSLSVCTPNSSLVESLAESRFRDTEDWRDDPWGLSCKVEFDRLVQIERFPLRAHVYNLETENHKFIAQNIVTHNCQNLESRWDSRLISSIKQTAVPLTGFDPPGTGSYFGTSYFGTSYFGGQNSNGQDVVVFDEQQSYLFAHRGTVSTQIDILNSFTPVASFVQSATVRWAEHWYGYGRIALGPSVPMQTRLGATPAGATYVNTTSTTPAADVYANYIRRGSDRAWIVDASQISGFFNYAGYTLDSFVNMAAPFQVGDPMVGVNGIGPYGPLTSFGAADNIYSFTDQGKPVPLSKAMDAIHSDENGQQFADPGFGWNYYRSVMGLRAHDLRGNDNPIGVGERMRGFTGHNGIPTAIFAARGELWVVYQTSTGTSYGYRGVFGPETANTGQPLFFPWFYDASGYCGAIFSTTTPNGGTQNLTMIRADGTNMTYMTIAADGRDDLAATVYSTGGGVGYLTTFDKDPNLLKTLRIVRIQTRGLESGSSWQIAMGFDTNPTAPTSATYTVIGTVATNGFKTSDPVISGIPITSISGRTIKPRVTQVAGGASASTTPPELRGTLEIEYDERPEQIEQIEVVVMLDTRDVSDNYRWDVLRQLVGSSTDGPFKIQLPDDLPPGVKSGSGGGQKYAMLNSVTARTDLKDDNIEAVTLMWSCWPSAVSLA